MDGVVEEEEERNDVVEGRSLGLTVDLRDERKVLPITRLQVEAIIKIKVWWRREERGFTFTCVLGFYFFFIFYFLGVYGPFKLTGH